MLNLRTLQKTNEERCKYFGHSLKDWSPNDWMTALVGEIGEAANILKKIKRGDFPLESVKQELAFELADAQIYLNLIASSLDIDMEDAVREKFNLRSKEKNCPIQI